MTQAQLVHDQVQGFAAAGWIPGATVTNHGYKWMWSRQGTVYVICGRKLTGDPVYDAIGDPDIVERFTPADVARICGMGAPSSSDTQP